MRLKKQAGRRALIEGKKMKLPTLKLLAAAALAVASLAAAGAASANVVLTSQGMITAGTDQGNIFGFGAGADLAGRSFTITQSLVRVTSQDTTVGLSTCIIRGETETLTVLVDGSSYVNTIQHPSGQMELTNGLEMSDPSVPLDVLAGHMSGQSDDGLTYVNAYSVLASTTVAFAGATRDFNSSISNGYDGFIDVSHFDIVDLNSMQNLINFYGAASLTSLNPVDATAAVPEPSGIALLGVGMLGLGGVASRRKRKTIKDIMKEESEVPTV